MTRQSETMVKQVNSRFATTFVPVIYHVRPLSNMSLEHGQPWVTLVYCELFTSSSTMVDHGYP